MKIWDNLKTASGIFVFQIRTDWRIQTISAAACAGGITTVLLALFFPTLRDPSLFQGAVFAGWIAGYLLFILGLVTVFVSLSRPERDNFQTRFQMLVQGQKGPHIDYLLKVMNSVFEPFAVTSNKEIYINDLDEDEQKFHIIYVSTTVFKGFLTDIVTRFKPHIEYKNGAPPPKAKLRPNRLQYIKFDKTVKIDDREFVDHFNEGPYDYDIGPNKTATIEHRFNCWVGAEEPNRHSAKRFVQKLTVVVKNDLPDRIISVDGIHGCVQNRENLLRPGESLEIVNGKDIEPAEHVYEFRVRLIDAKVPAH